MIDIEPTAEIIDVAAKRFRQTADTLDRIAAKIDAVVREREGIPILAHTLEGKKVCLRSSDCMNCDPERCVCRS